MKKKRYLAAAGIVVACATLLLTLAGPRGSSSTRNVGLRATGSPQLVGVDYLPAANGPMCEWMPASASAPLQAAPPRAPDSATSPAPIRVIRDTHPTYSAVTVDTVNNEIILQDENLFQIMVFDRLANTPANATLTEPKRVIGGNRTKIEFNCALYVDPRTGDIYSVNNDTMDTMVIFSRAARGNVQPDRSLLTPHGTYGVAVDEGREELFLTVEHTNAVVAYRKLAEGDEKPLRTLQGDRTGLEDPHGIALNSRLQVMYVANHGNARGGPQGGRFELPSITVYSLTASGNVAPLRVIEGPKTRLNWPAALYMDEERQELYVANDADDSILIFNADSSGDASPARMIRGDKTGILNPTGIYVDAKNNEIVVANMGNHSATVYRRGAGGNIAPLRTIRNAPAGKVAMAIGNPGAVAYDSKRQEILVPN